MEGENLGDVRRCVNANVVQALVQIDTVVERQDALRRQIDIASEFCKEVISSFLVIYGCSKVVDLSADENPFTSIGSVIEATFMCGGLDTEGRHFTIDQDLPRISTLRISLECLQNR